MTLAARIRPCTRPSTASTPGSGCRCSPACEADHGSKETGQCCQPHHGQKTRHGIVHAAAKSTSCATRYRDKNTLHLWTSKNRKGSFPKGFQSQRGQKSANSRCRLRTCYTSPELACLLWGMFDGNLEGDVVEGVQSHIGVRVSKHCNGWVDAAMVGRHDFKPKFRVGSQP